MQFIKLSSENDFLKCSCNSLPQDHILWEITSLCNQHCIYCYPSRTRDCEATDETRMNIAKKIAHSFYKNIHITGGEPTLCSNIFEVLSELRAKNIYITTNLNSFSEKEKRIFSLENIKSIGVSLDSIDTEINHTLRGNGEDIKQNIIKLIRFREENEFTFRIRIHCVMTGVNLYSVPDLLSWASEVGVDEVSCQPVSLPIDHRLFNSLKLKADDISQIEKIYSIEYLLFNSHYAISHAKLISFYFRNPIIKMTTKENVCMPFIDAKGIFWNCPCKKVELDDNLRLKNGKTPNDCIISIQCMTCLKHLDIC